MATLAFPKERSAALALPAPPLLALPAPAVPVAPKALPQILALAPPPAKATSPVASPDATALVDSSAPTAQSVTKPSSLLLSALAKGPHSASSARPAAKKAKGISIAPSTLDIQALPASERKKYKSESAFKGDANDESD